MDEYYYLHMIKSVLAKADIEDKGFIVVEDGLDLKRVIFIMDGDEYVIRMWNILCNGKVEYTLYKTVEDHGEDIDRGVYYLPFF